MSIWFTLENWLSMMINFNSPLTTWRLPRDPASLTLWSWTTWFFSYAKSLILASVLKSRKSLPPLMRNCVNVQVRYALLCDLFLILEDQLGSFCQHILRRPPLVSFIFRDRDTCASGHHGLVLKTLAAQIGFRHVLAHTSTSACEHVNGVECNSVPKDGWEKNIFP